MQCNVECRLPEEDVILKERPPGPLLRVPPLRWGVNGNIFAPSECRVCYDQL